MERCLSWLIEWFPFPFFILSLTHAICKVLGMQNKYESASRFKGLTVSEGDRHAQKLRAASATEVSVKVFRALQGSEAGRGHFGPASGEWGHWARSCMAPVPCPIPVPNGACGINEDEALWRSWCLSRVLRKE